MLEKKIASTDTPYWYMSSCISPSTRYSTSSSTSSSRSMSCASD